ncbi:hypothetical protein TWF730_008460 [Orbilia blumenaviensis]|uniref:Uncharacterized protein n=1 Tax=Orbilia blumenaviensis TaxID=1796055 RepID=A0AAV9V4R4_9PEZI
MPKSTSRLSISGGLRELRDRLNPIHQNLRRLIIQNALNRDVIKSLLADLLMTLQYINTNPKYEVGEIQRLVMPILDGSKEQLQPNLRARRTWLADFQNILVLNGMRGVNGWLQGEPPVEYLAFLEAKNPRIYRMISSIRFQHNNLILLQAETPKLILAAESLLKICIGEGTIDMIHRFPKINLEGYAGIILALDNGASPPPISYDSDAPSGETTANSNLSQSSSDPSDLSSNTPRVVNTKRRGEIYPKISKCSPMGTDPTPPPV